MSDYKELVEELRSKHIEDRYKRLTLDAADAIEKLCERPSVSEYGKIVEALRIVEKEQDCNECEAGRWHHDFNCCLFADAASAIEALEAEVKRLKEANDELREAQTYIDHYGDKWLTSAKDVPTSAYNHGYMDGKNEAEQALEPKRGEIVRCCDCKWYGIYEAKKDGTPDKRYSPSVCLREIYAKRRDPDWFCADGERKVQE